jgi:hypothetical protein
MLINYANQFDLSTRRGRSKARKFARKQAWITKQAEIERQRIWEAAKAEAIWRAKDKKRPRHLQAAKWNPTS